MIHPAVWFLALALVVVGSTAHANEVCIDDWSTAAPVVKAEGLASVEDVMKLARKRVKGAVVKVTLCMKGSEYVYRMLVRGADGRHSPVIVDAKHPFAR
jgi:uncharacterized membrane protein YkoI